MTCGISCVDNALNRSFYKLGLFIGRHPGYFLIVPVLLALLCMTGYQQIKYEIDPEYLFSPIRGEGKSERAIVENYFKVNYTHRFNVGRITRPGRFGRVIVISKDGDKNLLRSEVWEELRLLDGIIQNATVHYDGDTFTYRETCARWENECFTNDILNLDQIIGEVEAGELNLTFPVMFNPVTWDAHVFPVFFGGTQVSEDNIIISVPSLQLVYFVTADSKRQDARGAAWEEAFLDAVGYAEDNGVFKHISVARFASRTLDHELEKNTRTVVPYFSSTFILMALFSVVTCMMGDVVRSKPWLGLMGNVSAVMATMAAFGLAMYLGIEFIGINLAAPFLMIGIGIDDTFVMLAAWRRTSVKLSVPERMGHMMSEAAVSITITSLTDMISFWIGIASPFPSVRIFCTYSGFAVCFTYLWHVTFFAGCMAVSGHCEYKNLHAIFGFKVLPVSVAIKEKRSWLYRKLNTGGINRDDPDNPLDNKEHVLMKFFRDRVARLLNKGWVKTLIILIFAAYLGGACFGLTKIKEGLERRKLSKADSYSVKFFDLEDEYYREFPYRIQVIVTGDLNYSDPTTQMQIEDLMQSLENTSYITSPLYSESWLRSFIAYVDRNNDYLNLTLDSEEAFVAALKEIWLFPANPFSLDVKFSADGKRIEASRFMIQAINITDTNHEKIMVQDLRAICKQSSLNATVFHPYFVFFDQFELVRPTSIQSMVVGALIMMLISFIFIPNFLCSLWVAFSIVSIELGVAGYMSLWDVNLDSISMINLIMCIGFSVDFTAHICYTYMSSKARTADERVREALYGLGMPIVQGSVSTILGVVALLLADSYIFLVFFKMVFLVIFFGAMHGLFLLPVLLSLFGPGSCTTYPEDDLKLSSVEKSYPHPYCISHPQLALTGAFGSKTFLGAPYKAYGDEKDLGLGTSGEDSSESSSSKSQRRQAIEDENTRRRYEEGWRRSSHNLTGQSQFQPVLDLYGQDAVWTKPVIKIGSSRYGYDDMLNIAQGQTAASKKKFDFEPDRERDRRKSEENRPRKVIILLFGISGNLTDPFPLNIEKLGSIEGSIGSTAWTNRTIYKFQAIPYGQHPIEELRFKPPRKVKPWSGILDASKPGVRCPQITADYSNNGNEDCLTLSVYSNNLHLSRPVMVFIHGGWFYKGGADMFQPDYLLESDIVLVVVQYRLGPFGFLSTLSEDIPGNVGMMDVVASLEWIQKHIWNFGGNANEVTIFGQSAGASAVTAMLHSPLVQSRVEPLFHKAIIQSGSLLVPRHISDAPVEGAIDIATRLGCNDTEIEQCFRIAPTKSLLEAFMAHRKETIANRGFPYVTAANIVVGGPSLLFPQHPKQYHQFANKKISIMAGTTSQDGLFLLDELYRMDPSLPKAVHNEYELLLYVRRLHEKFGQTRLDGAMEAYAMETHFDKQDIENLRWDDLVQGFTDICATNGVKAPVMTEVHAFSRVNPNNVFLYSFDYVSSQKLERKYSVQFPHKGAVKHADELHYLFPMRTLDAADTAMAKTMVQLWTSFAISGVPRAEDVPVWPPVSKLYGPYLKINKISEQASNYRSEFTATTSKYKLEI